jgi:hypothetical protein
MTPSQKQKEKIKEKIKNSNYLESIGLPPDSWVVNYRIKNNQTKALWKSKQPQKEVKKKVINKGSFKKGFIPSHKNITKEQVELSKAKAKKREKQWRIDNKERINANERDKRKNDIDFKIKSNLRKRLSSLLSLSLVKKTEQTMDLLGCSIDFFKNHLKSKFTQNMSFDNYGDWHIDHIVPCSSFNLTILENRKKCFHYSNLQPLWAVDNFIKGSKISNDEGSREGYEVCKRTRPKTSIKGYLRYA